MARRVSPQIVGLVATFGVWIVGILWGTNLPLFLLGPLGVLVFAVWKEVSGDKGKAIRIVLPRVEELTELISAGKGKSIFSYKESLGIQTDPLWEKHSAEKADHIRKMVDCKVQACLRESPRQAFQELCNLSNELGAFIAFFREYFEKQGWFTQQVKSWYNQGPIAAYSRTYVNNLRNAAAALSAFYGGAIRDLAQEVETNRPLEAP